MAIKNLSLHLNEAGKIKIGIKGQMIRSSQGNEFRPPQKLDHFILTTTERDSNGDYIVDTALQNILKANPMYVNGAGELIRIPIRLLYDDVDLNFPTRYVSYVSGQLNCYGDGESSLKRLNDFKKQTPCPCPRIEQGYEGKDKCKPTGTLTCIIDEEQVGLFGTAHKFRTTSMNTVKGILGGIKLIQDATKGRIAGLPLLLTLNPKSTTTPSGQTTTVYVASICYRGSMQELRGEVIRMLTEEKQYLIGMDEIERTARDTVAATPAAARVGVEPGSDDERAFVEEFFPEAVVMTETPSVPKVSPVEVAEAVEKATPSVEVVTEQQAQEEQQEQTPEDPTSTTPTTVSFPAPPHAEIYARMLTEKDLNAAFGLAKRLKKEHLIYFLDTECAADQRPEYSKSSQKPEILDAVHVVLAKRLGIEITLAEADDPQAQEHPFIVELRSMPTREQVAQACKAYFSPIPVNLTLGTTELILLAERLLGREPKAWCAVCGERQYRVSSGTICQNGHDGADSVFQDPKSAKTPEKPVSTPPQEAITVVADPAPVVATTPAAATTIEAQPEQPVQTSTYPRTWDETGPIAREQLIRLVEIKADLEKHGKLNPERWPLLVGYFFDKAGNPVKTARDLTKGQGETFISMLVKNLDAMPF
jgi:hypothetical protein